LVFFLVPWWLRPTALPQSPYVAGFIVSVPVALAGLLWLASGLEGLGRVLRDARRWWLLLAILLVAWAAWSPEWALQRRVAEAAALQLAVVLCFALIVTCAGPPPRWIALALTAGLLVQGVVVIGQVALQRPLGLDFLGEFKIRPNRRGLSVLMAAGDTLMRPYGLTVHPNVIGGYFTVALLTLSGWLVTAQARRTQWALLIVFAVGLWSLLITFSRSAILAFGIGAAFIGVMWLRRHAVRPRWRTLIAVGGVAGIVAAGFLGTYAKFVVARAGVGSEVTELRSVVDRRVFTEIGLAVIRDYPITGIGIGNFPYGAARWLRTSPYRELRPDHAHSYPLLVSSELGLTGLTLWLLMLALGAGIVWRVAFDPFAIGLAAGALALFIIGLFDHYPWTIFHFALLLWACLGAAMRPTPKLEMRST
jgi:O-Antigen ligase